MNTPEIIRKKRNGLALTREEIFDFVQRFTRGEILDYQCSALLMAIHFRGLDAGETADLTEAMLRSGRTLDLSASGLPKVDKHSTGGVGDKTSLVVAPAAAAGGLLVPMVSGRALGHTGGTLDKLESIPGFQTRLTLQEFHRVLDACGLALTGQTEEFAPADRKLYALRDVTATVESIPLIAASIMSKKLAEDIDALVLDVKTGSGAFMPGLDDARELASRMVDIGAAHGTRVQALISDMSQPLGNAVGNALEVMEAVETLKGRGPRDLVELCRELTAYMFLLGGVVASLEEGRAKFDSVIASGQALEKFSRVVAEQGGNPRALEDYSLLPSTEYRVPIEAPGEGYIARLEARAIGSASMLLGAGRDRVDSSIDRAVGLRFEKKVGDLVRKGEHIGIVHSGGHSRLPEALQMIRGAISLSSDPVRPALLVQEKMPK
jgi:pyrimidine-nucleoside phosphorylase/thymidine phosphorylase